MIDVVSADILKRDAGKFRQKLADLKKAGYLTEAQSDSLSAVVDVGSAATHRGFIPGEKDVQAMLDSVNHMLQSIYVLKSQAQTLRKKTPQRP